MSLMSCLRHKLATETPASCSFQMPTVCSSEKRLRSMRRFLSARNELQTGLTPWGKVTAALAETGTLDHFG